MERHGFRREPAAYAEVQCSNVRCYDGVGLGISLYRYEQQGLTGAARFQCEERRLAAVRARRLNFGSLADICEPDKVAVAGSCAAKVNDCPTTDYWSPSAGGCVPRATITR